MKISFQIRATFPVAPSAIYNAWLNSEEHTEMTGGAAHCSNREGGEFSAWDGYITGKNIKLTADREIVQSWRTTAFKDSDEDATLNITFREIEAGCEFTLTHSNIPEGQPDHERGWVVHYLNPMKAYFKAEK